MKKTALIATAVIMVIAATVTAFALTSGTKIEANVSEEAISGAEIEKTEITLTSISYEEEQEEPEVIFEEVPQQEEPAATAAEETLPEIEMPATFPAPVIRETKVTVPQTERETKAAKTEKAAASSEKTVRVSFDANGGCVTTFDSILVAGKAYGTLPTPKNAGHNFIGWFTSCEGGTEVTAKSIVASKDHTLYARWTATKETEEPVCTVRVSFVSGNSAVPNPYDVDAVYGEEYNQIVGLSDIPGYHFLGWYTADGQYVTNGTLCETGVNHTLYGRWEAVDR